MPAFEVREEPTNWKHLTVLPSLGTTNVMNTVRLTVTVPWYRQKKKNRIKSPIYAANPVLTPNPGRLPMGCMRSPSVPSFPFLFLPKN